MSLKRNIAHLFVWQGSTFLVPLIVTPYLARVLGVHAYGVYGVTLAVVAYAVLVADWGFNLSATQKVARVAADPERLRALFWATLFAKIALGTLAIVVLALLTLVVPDLARIRPAIAAGCLSVAATAITTNWFLQGLERMGSFSAASLVGRLLLIPLVLLFVHGPRDVTFAILAQGAGQLVSAVASIVASSRAIPLGRARFEPRLILRQFADGSHQFASNISVAMYTQANAVFVGIGSSTTQAGFLTGSQRIQTAFQNLTQPVTMALYPRINLLTERSPAAAVKLMVRLLAGQAAFGGVLGIAMFVSAPLLVPMFLGSAFAPAVIVVQVLSAIPPLAAITNTLGTNMLLPLGLKTPYTISLTLAGVFNVTALLLLVGRYGALGGAIAAVSTEIFLVAVQAGVLLARRRMLLAMAREVSAPPPRG